jgi:hypothetical protein
LSAKNTDASRRHAASSKTFRRSGWISWWRLGHPVHAEMNLQAALRQPARDLFPHDDVARAWHPLDQRERPIDRVVVGDGDQVHAPRLGHRVDRFWPGIAIAGAEVGERVVVS